MPPNRTTQKERRAVGSNPLPVLTLWSDDRSDPWHNDYAMSLRAFNARILTTLRAGFALTVIISPGLKGFAR